MSTYKIIKEIFEDLNREKNRGLVADYIPELKNVNINNFAIAHIDLNGEIIEFGDINKKFTIQSISKIIAMAIALKENKIENFEGKVGFSGIDDPFNTFYKLEMVGYIPANPMINAGAITTTSMIEGNKIEKITNFINKSIGETIEVNKSVFLSEKNTGDRNKGIAYILKNKGVLGDDFEYVLENYFKQCSIEMDTRQLAKLAFVFGNNGKNMYGEHILDKDIVRKVNASMAMSGMYNTSGEYAVKVGIPSKSGVGGGIVAIVPNRAVIAVYSPGLDSDGNSLLGKKLLERISAKLNYSIF